MVRSRNTANIPVKSILKSGSTNSFPPSPSDLPPLLPVPSPQLSYSLSALPPQPRSRSLSPPAPTTYCTVRHKSNPPAHSSHGEPVSVRREPGHQGDTRRRQVTFNQVLTLYSVGGQIEFLKHHYSIPGYQAFRHLEGSRPLRRRTFKPSCGIKSHSDWQSTCLPGPSLSSHPEQPQSPSSPRTTSHVPSHPRTTKHVPSSPRTPEHRPQGPQGGNYGEPLPKTWKSRQPHGATLETKAAPRSPTRRTPLF